MFNSYAFILVYISRSISWLYKFQVFKESSIRQKNDNTEGANYELRFITFDNLFQ